VSQPDSPDDDLDKGVDDFTADELIEIGGLSDEEFARRFEPEHIPDPPPRQLPPDLGQLYELVGNVAISRRVLALQGIDSSDEIPGHQFDRFEAVDAKIGGMGLVLEARDPELERKVAIKLWKQSGPKAQRALLDEAKMLAKLSHHNVVRVYETGRWGERVFFVMEWIDGVDGHEWLKTPRSWREVRDVFVDAGLGLAAAHEAEIQHRDFKPDNMLVGNGRTVVADFGIADSLRNVENTDPRWGTPAGTPAYMAPERLRGEPGDARSDQFSFCVALWRALYGLRPFAGEEAEELLEAIELGEVRMATGVDVPRWLSEVVRKGLADDPDERHRDMHQLVASLRDEPPDGAADDGKDDDHDVVEVDGRVLHKPTASARSRWTYIVTALFSAVLTVMGFTILTKSQERPVAGAVEVTPYHAILGLIAGNEFAKAEQLWREHESELTDEQLLQLADACLKRAEQLAIVDRTKADEASLVAYQIAREVEKFGRTSEARKLGGQLSSDAHVQMKVNRPRAATSPRP